ncbi:uncharacterized protein METZ01_LOCUS74242 [marine metagenome]|uniref:Uncharacterized protein n=1 Tax=marine metagenome TaxID=408172 RepID=A0A381U165_9ZZZZ
MLSQNDIRDFITELPHSVASSHFNSFSSQSSLIILRAAGVCSSSSRPMCLSK